MNNFAWLTRANAIQQFRSRCKLKLTESGPLLENKDCAVFAPVCVRDGQLSLLFTKRSTKLGSHTGQISFPGGRCNVGESVVETALREMKEEIGLEPSEVWGCIKQPVVSLALDNVHCTVGDLGTLPDDLNSLELSIDEVDHVFTVPIQSLISNRRCTRFRYTKGGRFSTGGRYKDTDTTRKKNFNWPKHVETLDDYQSKSRTAESYVMPVYPSEYGHIWGLTAIFVDMVLAMSCGKDGYKRQSFF